jgi:hypothetical protein
LEKTTIFVTIKVNRTNYFLPSHPVTKAMSNWTQRGPAAVRRPTRHRRHNDVLRNVRPMHHLSLNAALSSQHCRTVASMLLQCHTQGAPHSITCTPAQDGTQWAQCGAQFTTLSRPWPLCGAQFTSLSLMWPQCLSHCRTRCRLDVSLCGASGLMSLPHVTQWAHTTYQLAHNAGAMPHWHPPRHPCARKITPRAVWLSPALISVCMYVCMYEPEVDSHN